MKNTTYKKGIIALHLIVGMLAIALIGLSGYLVYSNAQLKKAQLQIQQQESTKEATKGETSTTLPAPESKPEAKTEIKPVVQQVTSSQKSVTTTAPSKNAWSVFYDALVDLEGEFFVDYNSVDLDLISQSDLDFQKQASQNSRATLLKIQQKVSEGKLAFPAQLNCLSKENVAFDKYEVVINHSDTFLKHAGYILKFDKINSDINTKVGSFSYRIDNEEYDKAIDELDNVLVLLEEAKTNAQEANKIIKFEAMDDYLKWIDEYSAGLEEVREALDRRDYDYESDTDFLPMGEKREKAISDLADQVNDWIVKNVNSSITEAEKAYSLSNGACSKD